MKKVLSYLAVLLLSLILISCRRKPTKVEYIQFQELNENEFVITGYNKDLPKNIILPESFLGKPVTKIGKDAFKGAKIKSVVIPQNYTSIGENAFFSTSYLKEVKFLGESNITEIGNSAFWGNLSLEKITIPKSVTKIGEYAFYENVSLKSVTFEEGTNLKEIGDLAFSKNYSLRTINIPKTVTKLGDALFSRSNKLESIIVDSENLNYASVDGVLYNKNLTNILSYPMAKKDIIFSLLESVIKISDNAFYEARYLEEVILPDNLEMIGNYSFTNIKSLKRIVIPTTVYFIGQYAFRDSTNLTIFTNLTYEQNNWHSTWNNSNLKVYYKDTWHYNTLKEPVPNE